MTLPEVDGTIAEIDGPLLPIKLEVEVDNTPVEKKTTGLRGYSNYKTHYPRTRVTGVYTPATIQEGGVA